MTARTLVIETPDGVLRAPIELPDRPIRLAELAALVLPIDDRTTALAVERSAREGSPISCREGCAACCRQLVPVSPAEAFHLADVVEGLAPEHRDRVLSRFASRAEQLGRTWIGYGLRHRLAEDEKRAAEIAVAYHKLQIECPFLEDERCSIYDDRPATCREYAVVTRKEACRFPGRAPIRRVPIAIRFSEALSRVSAEKLALAADERIPLLSALDWAKSHEAHGRRKWPAEALFDELVRAIAEADGGASSGPTDEPPN
jgi:Fe-S-cluster containining protein